MTTYQSKCEAQFLELQYAKKELALAHQVIFDMWEAMENITSAWCIKPECKCYLCQSQVKHSEYVAKIKGETK